VAVIVLAGGAYALTSGDDDGNSGGGDPTGQLPGGQLPGDDGGSTPLEDAGPATPPPTGVPELDELAQSCHDGNMSDCDWLYAEALNIQFENEAAIDYTIYSQSCGGRLQNTASTELCVDRVPDP
jgi:hypothetical protein